MAEGHMAQPIDDALCQQCIAGEMAALAVLFRYCQRLAAVLCRRYHLHAQETGDLAVEFYLYLTDAGNARLRSYPGGGRFDRWLLWRFRGLLSHVARQRRRHPTDYIHEITDECLLAPELEAAIIEEAAATELQEKLYQALQHLSATDQRLFFAIAGRGAAASRSGEIGGNV
jgi:RNA polymerase sigma factor (sigma-70 family)